MRLVTFSSDYGPADEFVGVCHAVIARIAPEVRVIDIVHGVRGVRAVSCILEQSLPFTPAGVHLAVVDPGVGSSRRAVAVATGGSSVLVGPDNGLLLPAAEALGGATGAWELTDRRFRLEPVSATFHGRDLFAPAAAHVAAGVPPEDLGPAVPVEDLVRLPAAQVSVGPARLEAEVLRTDWFGNVQLAATGEHLEGAGLTGRLRVSSGSRSAEAVVGATFSDVEQGELVVLIDSAGHLSVAANGASAAALLGAEGTWLLEPAAVPRGELR